MGRIFYARVSTKDQKLDLQLDAARKLGIKTADIFVEKASGIRHDRPVLAKAIAALNKGDTLATYKLDRMGRTLAHLSKVMAGLSDRGVHFLTVEDSLCTKGTTGEFVLASWRRGPVRARPDPGAHHGRPGCRKEARPAAWPPGQVVALTWRRRLAGSWRGMASTPTTRRRCSG